MTLVPIIYTSLLIFTSLLLFVIIISYLSFKLKPKKDNLHVAVQPTRQVKVNKIQNLPRVQEQVIIRNVHPKSIIREKTEYLNKESKYQTRNDNHINNSFRNTKRIEIMNTSEKFQNYNKVNKPFEQFKISNKENFRITDSNILDFYSDSTNKNYLSVSSY
ncbi:MAG: hypothetical protein N2321_10755 [Melioribacteraceae bacterium]|nr:hypothetical protein [Melioribacteraceae bacterium]